MLEQKAAAAGETVSAYVRNLIDSDLGISVPTPTSTSDSRQRRKVTGNRTIKVGVSAALEAGVAKRATQARMTLAGYVRELIRVDLGEADSKPALNRHHDSLMLASEVHALAMQVKKLGTNFNQMAHQVNTGLVPLHRHEVDAMSRLFLVAMEKATALFEKVLAR